MNMQAMMKQAQAMQKDIEKAQKIIESSIFEGENALVKIKINGKREVLNVDIDKSSSFDSDDIEALQDMVMLAFNDALKKVDKMTEEKLGKYSNMVNGLF